MHAQHVSVSRSSGGGMCERGAAATAHLSQLVLHGHSSDGCKGAAEAACNAAGHYSDTFLKSMRHTAWSRLALVFAELLEPCQQPAPPACAPASCRLLLHQSLNLQAATIMAQPASCCQHMRASHPDLASALQATAITLKLPCSCASLHSSCLGPAGCGNYESAGS